MDFIVECDGTDGLVLIDEIYLSELNSELLYSMDIFLDVQGKSELKFDFPKENWDIVRERESKPIRNFCEQGKMVIYLLLDGDHKFRLQMGDEDLDNFKWLNISSGKLLVVTAGELIQCVGYPELEMEKLFKLKLEKGEYAISNDTKGEILFIQR